MPEISRFFGITVQMYYNDHEPPHFHVRYSGQKALIDIATLGLLRGSLSPRALGDYRLQLRFEDGVEGVVDLAKRVSFRGVFEPLRDAAYFAQVRVNPELGTVVWPNGADLDPDVLYDEVASAAGHG